MHVHDYQFSDYCGAHICDCGQHAHVNRQGKVTQELARCYCGWNLAAGERLDDDIEED